MSKKNIEHKLLKACVFDLDEITFFEKQVLNDSSEYTSARNIKKHIESKNTCFLLIKNKDNRICGYGIATLRHYSPTPSAHIYKIAVSPEFRRLGLGFKLLKELEKFIVKKNIFKIYAEARENNNASLGLFQKSGYKRIKTLYAYYSCLDESYELENGIKLCKICYHK